MFAKDHTPPHFHARYGDDVAYFNIETGRIMEGHLPARAAKMVTDWIGQHREELMYNWNESQKDNPEFKKIKPLE